LALGGWQLFAVVQLLPVGRLGKYSFPNGAQKVSLIEWFEETRDRFCLAHESFDLIIIAPGHQDRRQMWSAISKKPAEVQPIHSRQAHICQNAARSERKCTRQHFFRSPKN
jgi:hypothetical protein